MQFNQKFVRMGTFILNHSGVEPHCGTDGTDSRLRNSRSSKKLKGGYEPKLVSRSQPGPSLKLQDDIFTCNA